MAFFYNLQRWTEKNIFPSVCSFLANFKKIQLIDQNPKKILVIRLWALGEAILVLPLLKALKEAKPDTKITVLCTSKTKDVFYGQSFIDEVKVISGIKIPFLILSSYIFKSNKSDLVIDTEPHFNISSILSFFLGKISIGYKSDLNRSKLYDVKIEYNDKQHVVYTLCDLLKPLGISENLLRPKELIELKYADSDKTAVSEIFNYQDLKQKPFIGIHAFCGPSATNRAWPLERFVELIDLIKEKYRCSIILTGFGAEKTGNEKIMSMLKNKSNVFSITNLSAKSFFYLVTNFDLMISNDTGPMHVAAAQKIKTIGLFGPNTPVRFGPFPPEKNMVFYKSDNLPDHKPKHPVINIHKGEIKNCDGACMRAITVDEVFDGVEKLLKQTK